MEPASRHGVKGDEVTRLRMSAVAAHPGLDHGFVHQAGGSLAFFEKQLPGQRNTLRGCGEKQLPGSTGGRGLQGHGNLQKANN